MFENTGVYRIFDNNTSAICHCVLRKCFQDYFDNKLPGQTRRD